MGNPLFAEPSEPVDVPVVSLGGNRYLAEIEPLSGRAWAPAVGTLLQAGVAVDRVVEFSSRFLNVQLRVEGLVDVARSGA